MLGGCGGLERTDFLTVSTSGGYGSLEKEMIFKFLLLVTNAACLGKSTCM